MSTVVLWYLFFNCIEKEGSLAPLVFISLGGRMSPQFLFFLLADAGAEHPSLNPFFYFLAIVFKYLILPVP